MKFLHVLLSGLALLAASGAASAQDAAPAPPGQPTVKPVEDWQVRCFPVQSVSPCDMYQEEGEAQSHQRILSISIGYIPSMDRHALVLSVPLDISIPKGVVLKTDTYTSPPLKYRMCTRDGCFVQSAVDNNLIAELAKSSGDGHVNIVADTGKSFSIKFSLKGFAQAHDEMVAQAKAKAKAPAPAPAPAPAAH